MLDLGHSQPLTNLRSDVEHLASNEEWRTILALNYDTLRPRRLDDLGEFMETRPADPARFNDKSDSVAR